MAMYMNVRKEKVYNERRKISDCKNLLRFETNSVEFLTQEFLPESYETRGGALSPRRKMEIFLRYVGDPGFQSGIAEDLGVHRTTVCKTINEVLDSIVEKAPNWIKFPSTIQEVNEAKLLWQTRFNLPTVIGALDCTHIEIKKPTLFGDEYINRKGYASINVQATCDANEKFTSISAEWPGSVHDARIWRRCAMRGVISQFNGSACLLGDSGYGIAPWLITPFKPPHTAQQVNFNLHHARERVVIERIFGQLKNRFPVLGNCVRVSLDKIPKTIISCAILHNVGKHLNDVYDVDIEDEENHEGELITAQDENARTKLRGEEKRQRMLQQLNIQ